MKIVIDIPDAICERFGYEYSEQNLISKDVNESILDAFINGTPLPKGHGNLKDENEIKRMVEEAKVNNEHSKTFAENIIRFAPTIIEGEEQ